MTYKPQDSYYKKAKQEGYRSRAAYKLLELQQRFHLMRPGDVVLDFGVAQGAWFKVAQNSSARAEKLLASIFSPSKHCASLTSFFSRATSHCRRFRKSYQNSLTAGSIASCQIWHRG